MQHFEQKEIGGRYASYRPQVHGEIITRIATELAQSRFGVAVDVACGTGHSPKPLLAYADRVSGCDVSEMLAQAKASLPGMFYTLLPRHCLLLTVR